MHPLKVETTVVVSPLSLVDFTTNEVPVIPAHHIGKPPTAFQNPWPSFVEPTRWDLLKARFSSERNFVPVPPRDELVFIRSPDWGNGKAGLKATWIGHATFLVETTAHPGRSRGVRLLFDPVWSERTSPVSWLGPKRYFVISVLCYRTKRRERFSAAQSINMALLVMKAKVLIG